MSLLSLDSSFQNPCQNRHGSLVNVTSSIHSSPKSNRNTLKPTSSSKSIEKPPNNRNNSSTKKAPLAKTPQKYTNKDNFSPLPLSKRSIPRNDANSEFKRSYDPSTNRAPPKDPTLKRSSSKPLANISMCSSRVSSNLTHSDLRQSTFDKLNESIEALTKSALAESLYHANNNSKEMPPRGSQSSSRKPQSTKSREPEVSSFSASGSKNQALSMSGSKRNIMNSQNTSFVMQKVYSVNNKALNLTNLLTRPRSREDLSSRHPILTSASRKDVKENDPKFTPIRQSLDHSSSTSSKLNMQKRLSEPAVKSKGLEVRNLNTTQSQETPYIPSGLVKSLIGGSNLGDITKITEKDESSQFCVGDNTVSFGDCNHTLSNYIKTEEKEDVDHELALNSLKERFDVFVGTIATVLDEAAFREKRSFFIKLLTMVHAHKVKLSKFLASQEQNKKAFYFDLWHQTLGQQQKHDYTQTSIICEKEAGIDQMLEEAQLSRAIAFYSNKLLKKYFYQGFLGHYVVCKLGPESLQQEEQELLLEPIIKQDNKRSKSPSTTTPQDKRKSFPINQRSKTPTNSQSLNIANFNLKPTSTRKFTPTDRSFRSQTCLTSPNQSFIKGAANRYPKKTSKGTKEIMSASVLDQSFGNSKTMNTEELIPDQVMTRIPQPQKKEGLETLRFDTPRRMNTRNYTLESTERSTKSSTKPRIPSQTRFGTSPSCQQSQKKKPQEIEKKIPEKKEFTKVLKKKYEPSSRKETETTTPPLRQKTRSNSNLKRTEEKSVSSFTKTKGTRASYEEDDFFEVSEHNLQKALAFRKKKLTQFYGQKFLTILVTTTNRKIQAAWFLRIRNLLRKGLLGLLQAVESPDTQKSIEEIDEEEEEELQEAEEEEEESENMKMMMNIAKEHYETTVKINVFNNLLEYFVQSHEEGNMYAQYRDNYLKRSCFIKWFEVLPQLKEEDEKFELAYETIIKKFRFIMLAEKALRQWRNYIAEGSKSQPDEE